MQHPAYPWQIHQLLSGQPTVGALVELCEENHAHVLRLAPDVAQLQGRLLSSVSGHQDLYLEVLEQTPYTTLIHLTYYFDHQSQSQPDPDALLRVYHDSRQVEVMDLRQLALPVRREFTHPSLQNKWRANLFVSKWLAFCARQGHRFIPENRLDRSSIACETI